MIYGYARVSTKEQNEDRQIIALKNAGVEKIIFLSKNNPEKIFAVPNMQQSEER